ncbi:MAG TPA: glycosyltransferase family 4 protein [Microlunatus sp.]|nr:glycosyltransferase family 4 protein [Microlunatus sp.]
MRVGIVCPYSFDRPGGVQNHVLGLARWLARAGHAASVLAPGEPGPGLTDARTSGSVKFTSAGQAVPVPYNGSIARVNFGPLSAAHVRRWLQVGQFDLVHLHEPITPSIALLALWAADVPVVATFHTATPRSRSMQVAGGALRAAIEKIDAGIAVSESARRVVVQHLGRDAVVIPNGFDFDEFADGAVPGEWDETTGSTGVSQSLAHSSRGGGLRGRAGGRPRITFLGRLDEPRKGLDVLLAALPAIQAGLSPSEVEVVVAGQGSAPTMPGIRVLGEISDAEKVALLQSTDVFVAPHRERESFGIVLLEAMAAGAAVVASALPAFMDLLRPSTEPAPSGATDPSGLTESSGAREPLGRLVPVGDADALAAALVEAVRLPRPELRRRARAYARGFDWDVVAPAIVSVYRAALAAAPPATRTVTGPRRSLRRGAAG